MAENKQLFV